jgi:hypothetical protein
MGKRIKEIASSTILNLKDTWATFRSNEICVPMPVFITIDDCGFNRVYPDNANTPVVGYNTYECLLELSKKYHTKIALAFTTKYFDKDNISGQGEPLPYLDKLMKLLINNQDYIEIANHGWLHDQKNHAGEFYLMDENRPVRGEFQEKSIMQSDLIYKSWGLKFPRIFTPPYNAFVPGVTDRILSRYGCKYIISTPYLHDDKYSRVRLDYVSNPHIFDASILFLPRLWLGIAAIQTNLSNANLNQVKKKLLHNWDFIFERPDKLNHSYMTHIGNFLPDNHRFWSEIFEWIEKKPFLYLPENIESSVSQWLFLKHGALKIQKKGEDKKISLWVDTRKTDLFYVRYLDYITIKLRGDIESAYFDGCELTLNKKGNFTYVAIPIKGYNKVQHIVLE